MSYQSVFHRHGVTDRFGASENLSALIEDALHVLANHPSDDSEEYVAITDTATNTRAATVVLGPRGPVVIPGQTSPQRLTPSYGYSTDEEAFGVADFSDHRDALLGAIEECGLEVGDYVWTGRADYIDLAKTLARSFDLDDLLERAEERAAEDTFADDALYSITREDQARLEKRLRSAIAAIAAEFRLGDVYYNAADVQRHVVTQADLDEARA